MCCMRLAAQSCPILCDCSPPGSSVRGIFQARILEWVAIPFSGGLPDLGTEVRSPSLQADSLGLSHQGNPERTLSCFRGQVEFQAEFLISNFTQAHSPKQLTRDYGMDE